jgi:hypothetical protein
MKHYSPLVLSLGLLTSFAAQDALAQFQFQNPVARPAVSPYLNLLRRGQDPGLNYYNLVRPDIEFRQNIGLLQGETSTNRSAISSLDQSFGLPLITGHRSGFMTQGRYFMNNGIGGAGFGLGGGVNPIRPGVVNNTPGVVNTTPGVIGGGSSGTYGGGIRR